MQTCWVVCDIGKKGSENQCIGLAEHLGLAPEIKQVDLSFPWSILPPSLSKNPIDALTQNSSCLQAPWPDLIIASGRRSALVSSAIRTLTHEKTKLIQLLDPRVSPDKFDLIITPEHDRKMGKNILTTKGVLHRITPTKLISEAERFKNLASHLPHPIISVLIGGSNSCYKLTPKSMKTLGLMLQQASQELNAGILVTYSRRTPQECRQAFEETTKNLPIKIWDEAGENPYFGLLGLADYLVVTCDSISMISEACASGKPVYTFMLGKGSRKFERFHTLFQTSGYTRPFEGKLEPFNVSPLNEMQTISDQVRQRLLLKD